MTSPQPVGVTLAAFAAVGLTAGAAPGQGVAAPMPVMVVRNWAEPSTYRGPCPVRIKFRAALRGTWGEVTYRWVRSDGIRTDPQSFTFNNPGSNVGDHVVETEWTVTAGRAGEITAAVEVVADMYNTPQPSPAAPARATVVCSGAQPPARPPPPWGDDPCAYDPATGPVTTHVRACSQRRYDVAAAALAKLTDEIRNFFADDTVASSDDRERQRVRRRAFDAAQTAWRSYLSAACEAAYRETFPGSFASIHRLDCLEHLTRDRIGYLQRTYFPED